MAIPPDKKRRRRGGPFFIVGLIVVVIAFSLMVLVAGHIRDNNLARSPINLKASADIGTPTEPAPAKLPGPGYPLLTVTGYIVSRERIDLSSKFAGTVRWIGVKKGDRVKQGEVIVKLEDDEYRARVLEAQGRLALAGANQTNAQINFQRQWELTKNQVDSKRLMDEARRAWEATQAEVTIARGQLALAETQLAWCDICAPMDATILDKRIHAHELVLPQGFGGPHGPSTTLVSLADLSDLQVEIDLNDADIPKVHLQQPCRITPEAYLDKTYAGQVAEIAPEANRQKGTLQIKVRIEKPDSFLTPELNAKVDFLSE